MCLPVFADNDVYFQFFINADTQEEAENFYVERQEGADFIAAHPDPVRRGDYDKFAGNPESAISLADARTCLAYEPPTGKFYWREPPLAVGTRADVKRSNGIMAVLVNARYYPAHMLAVFLREGLWPRRKSISWRNGKRADNRWSNIVIGPQTRDSQANG